MSFHHEDSPCTPPAAAAPVEKIMPTYNNLGLSPSSAQRLSAKDNDEREASYHRCCGRRHCCYCRCADLSPRRTCSRAHVSNAGLSGESSNRCTAFRTARSTDDDGQRIFSYGTPAVLCLQAIAIIAACGSGVALALVNLVLGNFITLLSQFDSGQDISDDFMTMVSKQSYVPAINKSRHHSLC